MIRLKKLSLLIFIGLFACSSPNKGKSRFQIDNDKKPIAMPDKEYEGDYWDFAHYSLFYPLYNLLDIPSHFTNFLEWMGWKNPPESSNVNLFDEVPDSSWFTNRIGATTFTPQNMLEAAPAKDKIDLSGTLTILSAKDKGLTPGFLVEDPKKNRYLIKFDHPSYIELSTGAEVISTLILHTVGFNVPKNYVVYVGSKQFRIGKKATTKDKYGNKIPFPQSKLDIMMSKLSYDPQGRIRALASKFLKGRPRGPFRFEGRRWDDPNDKIYHQNRRELRGYRLFAAWLNHTDSRSPNSLDMFIKTGEGKGYIRHNLMDFGATLGSSTTRPKGYGAGYVYALDYADILKGTVSLGFYEPHWLEPKPVMDNAIGSYNSTYFNPLTWKPGYPNPAFDRMTDRDAFWATRIIMQFSNEHLKRAVKSARYSSPKVSDWMFQTLAQRRDMIGRAFFEKINPLDEFNIRKSKLSFENLYTKFKFGKAGHFHYVFQGDSESLSSKKEIDLKLIIKEPGEILWIETFRNKRKVGKKIGLKLVQNGGQWRIQEIIR